MRQLLLMIGLLIWAQTSSASVQWEYGGVVGSGGTAIAILKNVATGEKTFAAIGKMLAQGKYKVAYISRNKIVLDTNGKKIVLTSQGTSHSDHPSQDKPSVGSDAHFQKLVELGERLVGSGELSVQEVNELLSDEQQQWEMIDSMDAATEQVFGKTFTESP